LCIRDRKVTGISQDMEGRFVWISATKSCGFEQTWCYNGRVWGLSYGYDIRESSTRSLGCFQTGEKHEFTSELWPFEKGTIISGPQTRGTIERESEIWIQLTKIDRFHQQIESIKHEDLTSQTYAEHGDCLATNIRIETNNHWIKMDNV
jgi:hypothetical protein